MTDEMRRDRDGEAGEEARPVNTLKERRLRKGELKKTTEIT
jgi:hypothetical protein